MTEPRMTKQRAAVLAVLDGADEFRSAQDWHEKLKRKGDAPGLATVYRSLQALAESGDVDSVITDSGETLYRRCERPGTHHHHLRCRECGAAQDIDGPAVEAWAAEVGAAHGYSHIDHTIELTGVCRDCAAEGK